MGSFTAEGYQTPYKWVVVQKKKVLEVVTIHSKKAQKLVEIPILIHEWCTIRWVGLKKLVFFAHKMLGKIKLPTYLENGTPFAVVFLLSTEVFAL